MPRSLDIALLQTRPMPSFRSALDEVLPMADAAVKAGAEVIFLPEYCGGLATRNGRIMPPSAPEDDHPVLAELREFAHRHEVWIQIGSIAVSGHGSRFANRGYMIGPDGGIAGRYDKIHLFDIDLSENQVFRESATVAPGTKAVVHDIGRARIGHTICYDLRFPQLFRTLAQSGAEVLTCPAAFTRTTGEAHWHVLNRARAIENTCFMVSACAIGPIQGGGESYGHSLVVNPWGEIIADGGTLPGVVQTRIDLDQVREAAGRIPSLQHDRAFGAEPAFERSVA